MLDPGAGELKEVAIIPRVMLNCYISYYSLSYQRQSFVEDCYQFFVVRKSLILHMLVSVLRSSRERDTVGRGWSHSTSSYCPSFFPSSTAFCY